MNGNKYDKDVLVEIRIYYFLFFLGIYWILGIVLLLYGIYLLLDQDFFGYFLVLMVFYLIYYVSKRFKLGEFVIFLNLKGVKIINIVFMFWENVEYICIERCGKGKNFKLYLILCFVNKIVKG